VSPIIQPQRLTIFAPSDIAGWRSGYRPRCWPAASPASDTLSIIRGRHSLKIGGQFRWSEFNISSLPPRGTSTSAASSLSTRRASDGNRISLAICCLVCRPTRTSPPSWISATAACLWRIRSGRLQAELQPHAESGIALRLHDAHHGSTTTRRISISQSAVDLPQPEWGITCVTTVDKATLRPRLGLAWSPTRDHKTVIRAAYGIFFSGQEIRTAAPLQLAYNVRSSMSLNSSATASRPSSPWRRFPVRIRIRP